MSECLRSKRKAEHTDLNIDKVDGDPIVRRLKVKQLVLLERKPSLFPRLDETLFTLFEEITFNEGQLLQSPICQSKRKTTCFFLSIICFDLIRSDDGVMMV